jgi:ribosomal protein S18 acetylase RimI-like enzyme
MGDGSAAIRLCTPEDCDGVISIGRETYFETFKELNTPENMAAYLDSAFAPEKIKAEMADPFSAFYFLYVEAKLCGYMKVNEGDAQTDLRDPEALELERIYVRRSFHGSGFGKLLMEKALALAQDKGKRFVWLGVWEKNTDAIGFYKRMGFVEFARHDFWMGDDCQHDLLLRRDLA